LKKQFIFSLIIVLLFLTAESGFAQNDRWTQKDTLVNPFHSIEISKFDSSYIFLGGDSSDFFYSTNGGTSFSRLALSITDTFKVIQIGLHSNNSSVLFALTDSAGLFKITTPATPSASHIDTLKDSLLNIFAYNSLHPDTVYVGSDSGGFYRSTDQGTSWSRRNSGFAIGDSSITALAVSPFDGKIIYAGLKNGKLYKTTNSGNQWIYKGRPATSQITSIIIHPDDDHIVIVGTIDNGVYKSTNEGSSWSSWNSGLSVYSISEILSMTIDNTVRPVIYLAGTERNGVFKRKETDNSWTAINTGLTQGMVNDIKIHPLNHTIYYAVTQSRGIFRYKANQEPVLSLPYSNVNITVDSAFSMAVSATDPDSGETQTLVFGARNLPATAVFDSLSGPIYDSVSTRIFSWTPDSTQTGNDTLIFYVRDLRGGSDTDTLYINVNTAPIISVRDTVITMENKSLTINVSASDPDDNDTLYYSVSNLPSGAVFTDSSGTGVFNWIPNYSQSGIYYVTFHVHDSKNATSSKRVKITVADVNRAPYFLDLTQTRTINEGISLRFKVSAEDYDGDDIFYGADSLPTGSKFDSLDTKIFSWIPTHHDSGTYNAVFYVRDSRGAVTKDTVIINVADVNSNPVISIADTSYIVNIGDTLSFTVTGRDLDGDSLIFNAAGLPPYSSFNRITGRFLWIPVAPEESYYQIRFNTEDGRGGSDFQTVYITVNNSPVFTFVPTQNVTEGDEVDIIISATDVDNDTLSYSVLNAPANSTVDTTAAGINFQWTPELGQAGYYILLCSVSDGKGGTAQLSIQINVSPSGGNMAPQIIDIKDKTIWEMQTLVFQVVAYDDGDNDSLIYGTSTSLPDGAEFDSLNTQIFTWTPTYEDSGSYSVTFKVSDPNGKSDEETVVITVRDSNRAPLIAARDTSIYEAVTLILPLNASDPDSETFSITGLNLPQESSISTDTFSWATNYVDEGSYSLIFKLIDARNKTGYDTVNITVLNTNRAPDAVDIIYPKKGEVITPSDYLIWEKGTDLDTDDTLTYQIQFDDTSNFSSINVSTVGINPALYSKPSETGTKGLFKVAGITGETVSMILSDIPDSDSLKDNVKYFWRVRVIDNRGDTSAFSPGNNTFILNKTNNTPFPPVDGFSLSEGNVSVNLAPIISWYPAEDPDSADNYSTLSYILELDDDQFATGYTYRYTSKRGVSSVQVTDTLTDDHQWYYRVMTVDDGNATSEWSDVQMFYTNSINNPPNSFKLLQPAQDMPFHLMGDSVIFNWEEAVDSDPLDYVMYTLEVSLDSSFISKYISIRQEEIKVLRISLPKSLFSSDGLYYWRVVAVDKGKLYTPSTEKRKFGNLTTSIGNSQNGTIPESFELRQNFPNPFNSETVIEYSLPAASLIKIEIYNLLGQKIKTLVHEFQQSGKHSTKWNGTDMNNIPVSSGIYLYTFISKNYKDTKKLILVK